MWVFHLVKNRLGIRLWVVFALLALVLVSCKDSEGAKGAEKEGVAQTGLGEVTMVKDEDVVEITTKHMEFITPKEINSGWNTFKYVNLSGETHFLIFEKLPEGIGIENSTKEVIPVFQEGMDLINEGKAEEGFEVFGKLPEWYGQVKFLGGVGLVSPGEVGLSTLHLEPGNYLIECYVKMANGKFHSFMGMLEEIRVLPEVSEATPPKVNANIMISESGGIEMNERISPGQCTFEVDFKDQKLHEHFLGHDVHLVRLSDEGNLEELASWMNWASPEGLIDPNPSGVQFLGGIQEMPAGGKGYFTVSLKPGNYALISEVPDPASKNMIKTFKVEAE